MCLACFSRHQHAGPAPKGAEANADICKTCSVLLYVLERSRVDNSIVGPNWEELIQLAQGRSCQHVICIYSLHIFKSM